MSADPRGRTERKLMAVLAADVVGYSRLMGADEEGTLAALKMVRREVTDPKIEEHRGRIVKSLGDGLLVEFASVVDAVRCAVEVQREMAARNREIPGDKCVAFRIGINLGDIIIDDADIFGDGVNVAARLEALAEPGGICVSRVVRDQVRDKLAFGFEDLGRRQVKNIVRPVHIFRVLLDGVSVEVIEPKDRAAGGVGLIGERRDGRAAMPVVPARVPDAGGFVPSRPRSRALQPRALLVGGLLAFAALGVSAGLWSWAGGMNAAPETNPSPVIGGPVLFEKDQVVLIQSAGETISDQAKFLHANPDVKVVIVASCAQEEGLHEGAWVLAQLRANRVRDALEQLGIAGNRMTTENGCKAGGAAKTAREVSEARDGRVFVLWK
jgi:class 3 adenylate cyclase/outer membrane protein OmpA-like peptidoglycan-associated protein